MPDSDAGRPAPKAPISPSPQLKLTTADSGRVACERCGADMYRMHAVWRCPACGFKTDCCGW